MEISWTHSSKKGQSLDKSSHPEVQNVRKVDLEAAGSMRWLSSAEVRGNATYRTERSGISLERASSSSG
jgi:hypothetical protein